MLDIATGEAEDTPRADPSATDTGRQGGQARAANLSPERRSEIARAAESKRWSKPA